jgi:hypothetical protein
VCLARREETNKSSKMKLIKNKNKIEKEEARLRL